MFNKLSFLLILPCFISLTIAQSNKPNIKLALNDKGYYEMQSLDVMMFDDFYPEGHGRFDDSSIW